MSDEDDYFRKLDQEAKEKLRQQLNAEHTKAARSQLASLHHDRCGKCGGLMKSEHFRGIQIDRCEDCGAVLLDPGELEQLAGQDSTATLASFFSMFGSKRA